MELHPFRWDDIRLVTSPAPDRFETEILSLAAPIYEERYQRGGVGLCSGPKKLDTF
jgi:hypothetical protein